MDQQSLDSALADLRLPAIRFFRTIDSTNDQAWRWVENGAPHAALVIADEQSAGRGRLDRHWVTIAGSGLAFSLILLSPPLNPEVVSRMTGLGALAACQALRNLYSLPALVKWPNDILLDQRKTGGVLVELRWNGQDLAAAVIGIGINIAPLSLKPDLLDAGSFSLPATCVENVLRQPVDRLQLLHTILRELFSWLPRLSSPAFIRAWEDCLAYRGQWVELLGDATVTPKTQPSAPSKSLMGKVIGLGSDGSLRLFTGKGKLIAAKMGEIRLRPTTNPPG
jgi:BirA family biotin operon repressor/biotin-[acetyl-CoA-carboxylase] ligase